MSAPPETVLGVIGGLGSKAGVNFFQTLVERTPAEADQDHIETVVYSDPKVPDRNDAILRDGASPRPRLKRTASRLEATGVDQIVIASNTTHFYHTDVAETVDVPVPSMIQVTVDSVPNDMARIGVLTTTTAKTVGLYDEAFTDTQVVYPEDMDGLMDAIYAFKRGDQKSAHELFRGAVEPFLGRDIEAVILGCTEFSALEWPYDKLTIDPVVQLTDYCIDAHLSGSLG